MEILNNLKKTGVLLNFKSYTSPSHYYFTHTQLTAVGLHNRESVTSNKYIFWTPKDSKYLYPLDFVVRVLVHRFVCDTNVVLTDSTSGRELQHALILNFTPLFCYSQTQSYQSFGKMVKW